MEGIGPMDLKLQIVDAMNTFSVALLVLKEKKYNLGIEPTEDEDDDELGQWYAEKEGRKFWAWDPLRLLGLVALWEIRGDDWALSEGEEDLYNKMIEPL
jgi:hypothetical protein